MNWDVFIKLSPPEIQIHWITVSVAFVLGLILFSQKKGTRFHKTLGWTYVTLMMITAVSAFFIRRAGATDEDFLSGFSPIHLFIPLTVFGLAGAIIAIKNGKVKSHRSSMIGVFLGGVIIAGLFTFLPGRRMNLLFFGDPEFIERAVERNSEKPKIY